MQMSSLSLVGAKADKKNTVCLTSTSSQVWGDPLIFLKRKGVYIDKCRVSVQFK